MSQDTNAVEGKPLVRKQPEPIQLRSGHDHSLVVAAIDDRQTVLEKLAEKTSGAGYRREANVMLADADALKRHVMPLFRDQIEISLVTYEDLERIVAGSLSVSIARAFQGMLTPGMQITLESVDNRKALLLEVLTNKISLFGRECAEEGYRQGLAAREQSGEAMAARQAALVLGE